MKFISIVPTKYMFDAFQTSDTTLVLAHLIEEGNDYQKACLKFKAAGGKIWMDNSFYELKKNMTTEELVRRAKLIKADLIVLPDLPYRDNLAFMHKKIVFKMRQLGYGGKTMATVYADGKDFREDLKCFKELLRCHEIDIIAIPYVFREEDEHRRPDFLDLIEKRIDKVDMTKPIHMFGCNSLDNLKKEMREYVVSCDGTLPWKCGYVKKLLPVTIHDDPKRPKNYFDIDKLDINQINIIRENMKFMKEFCEDGK